MPTSQKFTDAMAGSKPRTRPNISAEEFVRVWQKSKNVQEVSDALKIPKSYCMSKAAAYRQLGVRLKMMARGPTRISVEELNKLIESEDGGEGVAAREQEVIEKAKLVTSEDEKEAETKQKKTNTKRIRNIV